LVAEASPGAYVEHGRFAARVPSQGLSDVFGAEVVDSDTSDAIEIDLGEARVRGAWAFDQLRPQEASVIGRFSDGSTAVVENRFGRGRAVLIASYPSLAYETTRDVQTGAWIAETIAGPLDPGGQRMLTRRHEAGDRSLLFVLNIGEPPIQGVIPSPAPLRLTEGLEFADGLLRVDLPARGAALALFRADPA